MLRKQEVVGTLHYHTIIVGSISIIRAIFLTPWAWKKNSKLSWIRFFSVKRQRNVKKKINFFPKRFIDYVGPSMNYNQTWATYLINYLVSNFWLSKRTLIFLPNKVLLYVIETSDRSKNWQFMSRICQNW